jgi:hypothetical protein
VFLKGLLEDPEYLRAYAVQRGQLRPGCTCQRAQGDIAGHVQGAHRRRRDLWKGIKRSDHA